MTKSACAAPPSDGAARSRRHDNASRRSRLINKLNNSHPYRSALLHNVNETFIKFDWWMDCGKIWTLLWFHIVFPIRRIVPHVKNEPLVSFALLSDLTTGLVFTRAFFSCVSRDYFWSTLLDRKRHVGTQVTQLIFSCYFLYFFYHKTIPEHNL